MMYFIIFIFVLSQPCGVVVNLVSSSTTPAGVFGRLELFRSPARYEVESWVVMTDETHNGSSTGYNIKASLLVEPTWAAPDYSDILLKFHRSYLLQSPKLHLRRNRLKAEFLPHPSVWDSHTDSIFYAHWKNGVIESAHLDPSDVPDVLNYKKSLISLFQFQAVDGEHVESDISGKCDVIYESISTTTFKKTKVRCSAEEEDPEAEDGSEEDSEDSEPSSELEYAVDAQSGALVAAHARQALRLGPRGAALGLRAGASARRAGPAPAAPAAPAPAPPGPLPAALSPLGLAPVFGEDPLADHTTTFIATSHTMHLPRCNLFCESMRKDGADRPSKYTRRCGAQPLEEAVERARPALQAEEAGRGGGAEQAAAAAELLPALRAAREPELAALLRRESLEPVRPALVRLLALAGTAAAHRAADGLLRLAAPAPPPLAREYLAAAALAARPRPALVAALLRLGGEARDAAAGGAALLAAAAAAPRAGPAAAAAARDHLLRSLARCKEEECRAVRLLALGNLRREDTAEALLEHAERGAGAAARAALHALQAAPPAALRPAPRRRRLLALACGAGRPLRERAAALDLAARRAPLAAPAELRALLAAAAACGPRELRRLLWQRLRQLAADDPAVAAALRAQPLTLVSWDAQAQPGTSSVLVRSTGWAALGQRARLESVQVAAGGLLSSGRVRLVLDAAGAESEQLAVEMWTRGLEALAGTPGAASGDRDEPDEPDESDESDAAVAGGLELGVGGARLAGLRLFVGRAELLGHVWAGAGSEPTPVLRALRPLRALEARAALVAGAALHWRRRAAAALALDAQAQVSLWSRSARAELELRAAVAGHVSAAAGPLRGWARSSAAPRLRLAADLDFYDGVTLCVRAHVHAAPLRHEAALGGGRRAASLPAPGRTLALGADNDRACRRLVAPEH
ncbi:microsomal triacylglycerol transfer protein-like [Achroia grisella]|uniref:microsomal triacylglycerol transfer protein-like n=1 Tax=Achroia grisella TaxID=688607 RepID=UPI0027D26C2D|nr:microsomal triacylglycerol transfer protein-like [Achroia grisella]